GLVRRGPNPRDGRGTLAAITEAGREVMEAATADLVAGGFGLAMLTPDEHEQLFGILRRVRVARDDFIA
ncbi:MAG: MarR family transcriptional regulator, partial [Lapillicoccus sp.]